MLLKYKVGYKDWLDPYSMTERYIIKWRYSIINTINVKAACCCFSWWSCSDSDTLERKEEKQIAKTDFSKLSFFGEIMDI